VIAAGVDDDEVIGDSAIVEEKHGAYDMTTIGDGQKTGHDNEAAIMIDVEITETR